MLNSLYEADIPMCRLIRNGRASKNVFGKFPLIGSDRRCGPGWLLIYMDDFLLAARDLHCMHRAFAVKVCAFGKLPLRIISPETR
jgi:hypothetical protein